MDLIFIVVAVLGFVVVAGAGFAFAGGGAASGQVKIKRLQSIGGGGEQRDRRARAKAAAANPENRRKQIVRSLKDQERQQKKATLTLSSRLHQAGLPFSPVQFYVASGVLGIVVMVAVLIARQAVWIDIAAGAVAGLGLPRFIVGFLAKRRTKKFTGAFSDAMDIIVRGIKTGLPVNDCLRIIARESIQPLGGEFRRLVENLGMGMDFDVALDKMYERMPTPELKFFAIVMTVQQKTGGNLAEALGNLSTVLRARKLMREKVKALSSEAVASSMIIGALPPGVVMLISITQPAYMLPLFTDPRGKIILVGAVLWMSLGIFVMRRMINFKM
ncbi:MAG TPA: type II secretion system F family protein [Caulobacteraceae bacterium]|nr:type II secretion system F family protein [Caulobacteraceae bacterium]